MYACKHYSFSASRYQSSCTMHIEMNGMGWGDAVTASTEAHLDSYSLHTKVYGVKHECIIGHG